MCLFIAQIALLLVKREARKEAENIIQLIFDDNFDVAELGRHVKKIENSKLVLDDSRDEILVRDCFTKSILRTGLGSLDQRAVPHKKRIGGFTETNDHELIVRRVVQLAKCFESKDAFFGTLYS